MAAPESASLPKRFVATTGHRCPLGCLYCFAHEDKYTPPSLLPTAESYATLSKLAEYTLIQPACDTELLLNATQGLDILRGMISLRKDVSFATKMAPSGSLLIALAEIADSLHCQGNILSVSVSICCIGSAKIIEPNAPSPESRINAVRSLKEKNIHCIVAIRPLLPFVSTKELSEIVDRTWRWCDGYTSGPYYFKQSNTRLMSLVQGLPGTSVRQANNPDWLSDPEKWKKLETPDLERYLGDYIATHTSLKLYGSNIEAVYSARLQPRGIY